MALVLCQVSWAVYEYHKNEFEPLNPDGTPINVTAFDQTHLWTRELLVVCCITAVLAALLFAMAAAAAKSLNQNELRAVVAATDWNFLAIPYDPNPRWNPAVQKHDVYCKSSSMHHDHQA